MNEWTNEWKNELASRWVQDSWEHILHSHYLCVHLSILPFIHLLTIYSKQLLPVISQSLYHDHEKFRYKTKYSTHREFTIRSGKMCNASPLPIELRISKMFYHVLLAYIFSLISLYFYHILTSLCILAFPSSSQ